MKHFNETHGHTKGRNLSREYISWRGMKQRCLNPKCKAFFRLVLRVFGEPVDIEELHDGSRKEATK